VAALPAEGERETGFYRDAKVDDRRSAGVQGNVGAGPTRGLARGVLPLTIISFD